jgi:membrane fusion protein, multidrug efflux system
MTDDTHLAEPVRTPPTKSARRRGWLIAGVAALVLVGGLAFTKFTQVMAGIAYGKSFPEPAQAVLVTTAQTVTQAPVITAVGALQAVNRIDLKIERSGVIAAMNFKSGDRVKKGQILLQLDTAEERADLAAAEIEARRTRIEAEREVALLAKGAASQAMAEETDARAASASARVSALRVAIDRKLIRAPFSGRVGITDLKPGQYVSEGSQLATLIGNEDGIYVDFTLPQDAMATLDVKRPVRVKMGDQTAEARIVATEPGLDTASRSLGYRALINDAGTALPAGSLVSVEVEASAPQNMVVIPRTAVMRSPYGSTVYALTEVEGQTRAKAMLVELGPAFGSDQIIVTSGLAAGTVIAADGVFKLRDGSLVQRTEDPRTASTRAAPAATKSDNAK